MKLHVIVLSLTLTATAAHADLFDKLKNLEKDVSELKEAIAEIGGDDDEAGSDTANSAKAPENSPPEAEQETGANSPTEEKPSSKPGSSGSSNGQKMYGWLNRVNYDDRGAPQYPYTRINLAVFGVTTTRSTGIPCNLLYLNNSLPQIDGISVDDLSSKSTSEINQVFVPHRGKFIRLDNVEVHPQRNQRICVANSVAIVEDFAKANVTFSEVGGYFMERVVNVAIRAGDLPPPNVAPDTIYRPEEYECKFYRWASAQAAKAWYEEYRQTGYPRPDSFQMEFVGVRPVHEPEYCEFDTMNIVANETEKPVATAGTRPVQPKAAGQSRFSVTLKGDIVYINGLTLGMPEDAMKEELRKLAYETENILSGQINLSDGTGSLRAELRQKKLTSLSTNEQDITEKTKNEIVDALKTSFGDKISCQENRHAKREIVSCNYSHKGPGEWTSLTVSFQRRGTQTNYVLGILLK